MAVGCQRPVDDAEDAAAKIDDRVAQCFASYDAAFDELEDEEADTAKELSGLFASFVARLVNDAETAAYVPAERVVAICSKVHEADNAGPGLYRVWADLAMATPSFGAAKTLQVLEAAATATAKQDVELAVDLWLAWLGLTVRSSGQMTHQDVAVAVDAAYGRAIAAVPGAVESARLWDSRIHYCLVHRDRTAVRDAFTKAIAAASTVAWEVGTDARSSKVRPGPRAPHPTPPHLSPLIPT